MHEASDQEESERLHRLDTLILSCNLSPQRSMQYPSLVGPTVSEKIETDKPIDIEDENMDYQLRC